MRGPTFHIPDDGPPWIETHDGRRLPIDSPEGRAYAARHGVRQVDVPRGPIGNTPRQDHISDPYVTDPRPVRRLTRDEERVIRYFAMRRAWFAVAGFETWRASDRWLYIDVLGVGRDADEAEKRGTPVGPIEVDSIQFLRMVGGQLAMRMADPFGTQAHKSHLR